MGGAAGAGAALNEVTNNYLSHKEQEELIAARASCVKGDANSCQRARDLEELDRSRDAKYAQAYDICRQSGKCKTLKDADDTMQKDMGWPGLLSKNYESKGDPGAINAKRVDGQWVLPMLDGKPDPGGFSYGSYQIETQKGTMTDFMRFLKTEAPEIHQTLQDAGGVKAATDGENEFVAAWQGLARDTGFAELQHQFIEIKKFESAANYAQTLIPDLKDRSPVLLEIIWSGAVQHGRVKEYVIKDAFKGKEGATDAELINHFYDVRSKYVKDKLNMPFLLPRLESERQKALDWLNKPRNEWK